ncbi:MAG: prenyltransferase [Anaerolineaceae bacterium]
MKYVIGVMRPPFLPLAVACVFLGLTAAIWGGYTINVWHAVLCFVGGILAHGAVNAFNEYEDVKSGLDFTTTRTPFSGGSGTIITAPEKLPIALWTAIISSAICVAIGVYFAAIHGWEILALGALGLFVIIAYTPWFNKQPILCLISPGLGFGTLMVNGTFFCLTGTFSWAALLVSFIPFFLVSNLLLLNEFPDADADQQFGRKHLPILIGRQASAVIFVVFEVLTYVTLVVGVAFGLIPAWTLLGLVTLVFAIPAALGALKNANDLPKLAPSMGQNVLLNLITPVLMGIGLLIR